MRRGERFAQRWSARTAALRGILAGAAGFALPIGLGVFAVLAAGGRIDVFTLALAVAGVFLTLAGAGAGAGWLGMMAERRRWRSLVTKRGEYRMALATLAAAQSANGAPLGAFEAAVSDVGPDAPTSRQAQVGRGFRSLGLGLGIGGVASALALGYLMPMIVADPDGPAFAGYIVAAISTFAGFGLAGWMLVVLALPLHLAGRGGRVLAEKRLDDAYLSALSETGAAASRGKGRSRARRPK